MEQTIVNNGKHISPGAPPAFLNKGNVDERTETESKEKRSGSLVLLDNRALDRECLVQGINAYKPSMEVMAFGSIEEWKQGVASGEISEVFACGTAAVITPIGELKGEGFAVGDINAPAGEVTMSLRKELTDIQYGRQPDRHGWLVRLG